jgi:hypothetical protein
MANAAPLLAQADMSGNLSFTGYAAESGSPSLWGQLDFNPRLAWQGGGWQLKLNLHAIRDSRPEIGRDRILDAQEREDFRAVTQFEELSLRRTWGGALRREIKFGLLPVRWGRTDGFTPTDTVAPLDFTDLLDVRRPGVPALSFALRGEHLSWQLLSLPVFSPDRLPPGFLGAGGRFSEPLPERVMIAAAGSPPALWRVRYQTADGLPARTFSHSEWATRMDWVGSAFELGISYKRGFDKMARFTPALLAADPLTQSATLLLRRDYDRVEIYGVDFLAPLGAFILRAEASAWNYQHAPAPGAGPRDKLLYTLELEHSRRDWHTILAWGDVRYRGGSPAGGSRVAASGPSLSQGGLPAALVSIERKTMGEWGVKFSAILDTKKHGWMARGSYSFPLGAKLRAEIGADFFGGPGDSFYGMFNREDRARAGVTCSF